MPHIFSRSFSWQCLGDMLTAWCSPGSGGLESSWTSRSVREGTRGGGGDTGRLPGASGSLSGTNVPAHLEGEAALFCAEAETTRGKAERLPVPAPIPSLQNPKP